jgi:Raf kinase inhibitor-like YbhB/YbcL family protein
MANQHASLGLSSPAFEDGDRIPDQYGREARDINPPLEISDVPGDTESLALLVEDPDAKAVAGKVWTHWLVYDIAANRREIPKDWDAEAATEGRNDFEEREYGGPSPPEGTHTYVFRLYALDDQPTMFDPATEEDFQRSIEGAVIDEAELRGTYSASQR